MYVNKCIELIQQGITLQKIYVLLLLWCIANTVIAPGKEVSLNTCQLPPHTPLPLPLHNNKQNVVFLYLELRCYIYIYMQKNHTVLYWSLWATTKK